jgi:hypothetical protein
MTRAEWPDVMRKIAEEKLELSCRKNANYAGDEDAWANFNLVEIVTHGKITREQGIFVRMVDKMSRLGSLLFDGKDQVGEPTKDTIRDLGIYSDILYASLEEREEPVELDQGEDKTTTINALRNFFATKSA